MREKMQKNTFENLNYFRNPQIIQDFRDKIDEVNSNFSVFDKPISIEAIPKYITPDGTVLNVDFENFNFPILIFDNDERKKIIISFSSGDRTKAVNGNLFVRWKYHKYFDAIYICIDSPMQKLFPKLSNSTPSWYLGTKNDDLCLLLSKFISKLSQIFKIDLEDITLLGSSAGGYAACRIGSLLNGCKVIAISPQLIITNWHEYETFLSETGLHLENDSRNNIVNDIANSASKFFITFNWLSKRDTQFQLYPLLNKIGISPTDCYGLNNVSNINLWVHASCGESLHSAGIGKLEILWIYNLLNSNINTKSDLVSGFVKFYNELLNEKGKLELKLSRLTNEISVLKKHNNLTPPNLRNFYISKNYDAVVRNSFLDAERLFYTGMSFYRLKQYTKAVATFELLRVIDSKREFFSESLLGFSYFRQKQFSKAFEYFYNVWEKEKTYISTRNYLALKVLANKTLSPVDLLEFDKYKSDNKNLFLDVLDIVYPYLPKSNTADKTSLNYLIDIQYNLKLIRSKPSSDELYILIHPLITGKSLFGNREFNCDVLFIEQKQIYCYFMLFVPELLEQISQKISSYSYKKITILSTSAGAYFGILLGAHLSKELKASNIIVHAFSPQTNIDNNDNINKVTHYFELQKFKKYSFVAENIAKYGNLAPIIDKLGSNIKIHIYYGTEDKVDCFEANNLFKLNKDYIFEHAISGFPYHQSIFLWRYSEDQLPSKLSTMYATAGGNSSCTINVGQLIQIKRTFGGDLSDLLPHMINKK